MAKRIECIPDLDKFVEGIGRKMGSERDTLQFYDRVLAALIEYGTVWVTVEGDILVRETESSTHWKKKYSNAMVEWFGMFLVWLQNHQDLVEYFRPQLEKVVSLIEKNTQGKKRECRPGR